MLRRLSFQISRFIKKTTKMAEALDLTSSTTGEKRMAEAVELNDDTSDTEPSKKKLKQENAPGPMQGRTDRKRKVAMLLAYCGKGYYGIQRNPGFNTIEEELLKALLECELIPKEHFDSPQKMSFQRAARTDKGVSAVGNLVSLKMLLNQDNLIQNINDKLPAQIRVIGIKRATKAFNSKNQCGGRTYAYMTPTYAFAPLQKFITEEYRTTEEVIAEVNKILSMYVGTHNFHNFTSGIKPNDPSAKRYIISFESGEPFVRDGIEFAIIRVRGQSFMLHHIRKMIGLMIAVLKGYCGVETINQSWQQDKVDIPKAPGVGLMLEKLHYDGYNKKYGKDGLHEPIEWPEYQTVLDKFQEEHIFTHIIKSEKEEKTMLKWLGTLHFHKFDMKDGEDKPMWPMMRQINKQKKESQENEDSSDKETENTSDYTAEEKSTSLEESSTKGSGIDSVTKPKMDTQTEPQTDIMTDGQKGTHTDSQTVKTSTEEAVAR